MQSDVFTSIAHASAYFARRVAVLPVCGALLLQACAAMPASHAAAPQPRLASGTCLSDTSGTPMRRNAIIAPGLPPPTAPFSYAVRVPKEESDLLYLSGQVGTDPHTDKIVDGGFESEVDQAMKNIATILGAAGLGLDDVVKVNIYVADMKNFARLNAVYVRYFHTPYPARTTVAVAGLPLSASVEIEVVARDRGALQTSDGHTQTEAAKRR